MFCGINYYLYFCSSNDEIRIKWKCAEGYCYRRHTHDRTESWRLQQADVVDDVYHHALCRGLLYLPQ